MHDIGKFALIETMPKSFDRITQQAKSNKESSRVIEKQHLGIDHTIIGKRLAEKWLFPDVITLSIWLHHNINTIVLHDMPEATTAAVIHLADLFARKAEIGTSGSFNFPESVEPAM